MQDQHYREPLNAGVKVQEKYFETRVQTISQYQRKNGQVYVEKKTSPQSQWGL